VTTFDRHQFDKGIQRPGSFSNDAAVGGVDSKDLAHSMSRFSASGRTRRWIPEFAYNNAQLRCVLMSATMNYCFHGKTPPGVEHDLELLKEMAAQRQARLASFADQTEILHWNRMAQTIHAAGKSGYMALIAGISYRAWRLRWHDSDIAREAGMTTTAARDLRRRLVHCAEVLGFPTHPKKRNDLAPRITKEIVVAMWEMHSMTTHGIARALNCAPHLVNRLLKIAGVYVPNRRRRAVLCSICQSPREQRKSGLFCRKCSARRSLASLRKKNGEPKGRKRQENCSSCGLPLTQGKRQRECKPCLAKAFKKYRLKQREEKFFRSVAYA
jgi:hypothetical protein